MSTINDLEKFRRYGRGVRENRRACGTSRINILLVE